MTNQEMGLALGERCREVSLVSAVPEASSFHLGYRPSLNGLRGVAVILVMIFHSRSPFLPGGFLGVDMFFVLSGFLITSLLLEERARHDSISLGRFYARRALRLLPALILLLAVYLIFCGWLAPGFFRSHLIDALIALFYSANWTLAFGLDRPTMLGHTWSLSVEEQFYILWPAILIMLHRFMPSRRWILYTVAGMAISSWGLRVLLTSLGGSVHRLQAGLDTHADSVLMGCVLALALSLNLFADNLRTRTVIRWGAMVSVVGLAVLALYGRWSEPTMTRHGYFLAALFTSSIILEVVWNPKGVLTRALEWRALVWIGTISYGLYLWHYPIFRILPAGFESFGWQEVLVLGGGLTFLAATASFYVLERPALRLKSRFQRTGRPGQEAAGPDSAPPPSLAAEAA